MRVLVIGGTGLLGTSAAIELNRRGHDVVVISRQRDLPPVPGLTGVRRHTLDVFEAGDDELEAVLSGVDALVYMVGPDERVMHPLPVAEYLQSRIVGTSERVFKAAVKAGVTRLVITGSFFVTWDRMHPDDGFADRHPYVAARRRQAEIATEIGRNTQLSVVVLEIPYVLGGLPGCRSVVLEQLTGRFKGSPVVLAPDGAVVVTSNTQVATAVAQAVDGAGEDGGHYPVGERSMTYRELMRLLERHLGGHRPIVWSPAWFSRLPTRVLKKLNVRKGRDSGLDYNHIVDDILTADMVVDFVTSRRVLDYGHTDLESAAATSVKYSR